MEKNTNLEELATFYLVEPEYLQTIGCSSDEAEWIDGQTVEENDLPTVDYYFDEDVYKENLDEILGDFPHYIVKAEGCTWDKKTGFKLLSNKYETLKRDYDVIQYYQNSSKDKKVLELKESCHDVPMGYPVTIVGITESEFAYGNIDQLIRNFNNILKKSA